MSIQQSNRSRVRINAPRRLILIHRSPLRDDQIHQRIERSNPNETDLQRPDRLVLGSAPSIHVIQVFFDGNAAILKHDREIEDGGGVEIWRVKANLPVQDVVARDGGGIGEAGVFDEKSVVGLEKLLGYGDAFVEVLLVGLVAVDAENDVPSADESEVWCSVVEPSRLDYVADPVTVQPGEGCDDEFIKATDLDMNQADELARRHFLVLTVSLRPHLTVFSQRQQLKVTHVRQQRKRHLSRLRQWLQVYPKIALR